MEWGDAMRMAELVRVCVLMDVLVTGVLPVQAPALASTVVAAATETQDGQHDFDFEFGNWHAHLRRLVHPLSGSNDWVEYDGTSVVRKVWDGKANLGEFDVSGKAGHIEGLSLRLYNPDSRQWSIFWANQKDGSLGVPPMIGGFRNGRGEFYDQEMFNGKAVFVRFVFSEITKNSFRLEQAFSADGGKSWEPNWIVNFTRTSGETAASGSHNEKMHAYI